MRGHENENEREWEKPIIFVECIYMKNILYNKILLFTHHQKKDPLDSSS